MREWIYHPMRSTTRWVSAFGAYLLLTFRGFAWMFIRPPNWRLLQGQLYDIGIGSFFVVALTGLATGLVLATQSFYQLADKGLAGATGLMVSMAEITELGPVLTAVMVTGRVGASMCAELGSMRVSEQVDALRSMSINAVQHLVTPRLVACLLMVPLLTAFSILLGIWGGWLISVYGFDMASSTYWTPIPEHIKNFDIALGLIKSFVFGFLISSIACYKGITTTGGAAGVGRATTSSVVATYTAILFINFFITLFMNMLFPQSGL
jgi:phospholipid/cholesterol/gamma-HCH transport system permease protein